jgi:cobalt-zinc-cadmium efflux system outer membrane protein
MAPFPFARLAAAALALHAAPAAAEPLEIDLRAALERAHRLAPDAVAARGRIAEAEAGAIAADVAFSANPEIDGGAGLRLTDGHPIDAELRIAQDLEPWRRGPRRQRARAEVRRAFAEVDVQRRELDLEVSLAFYGALHAGLELELSGRAAELAERGATAAERRRRAGDITDLDANLARAARGRARAAVEAAMAERSAAIGRLAALIGAGSNDVIAVRGDLKEAIAIASPAAADRPDVRALAAEREVAAAEHAQAAALGRPEVGLWLGYQREDTADIVLAGLRVSLPVWNRAHGEQAAASARQRRASETRDAALRVAGRQIRDALAASAEARRSVEVFEREVLPALDDAERLLEKTLDAGQIAVSEYLFAAQELLAGRREHLQRLLALANASAHARHAAGVSP